MTLRYMIIGAGGTGAPLGAFLAKNGADVTLIARAVRISPPCRKKACASSRATAKPGPFR